MKKSIVLILLIIAASTSVWWWLAYRAPPPADSIILYGNVDIREARLAFNSSEHVGEVLVQEGDAVKQGQLLARLHKEKLIALLAQAEAQEAAQQQVLARLEAGSRIEDIEKAEAELTAMRARAKVARDTNKRLEGLVARRLASDEEVDIARGNAAALDAEVVAGEKSLALLRAGPRKEDIAQARAELAARSAGVDLAREQLADTDLYAPADGYIRDRILEPGDFATPQTPALTLAFTNPVWVRTYLPEPLLGRIKPGMSAAVFTDSYPGKSYPGWVGYISPTAEFTPKNVETPELRTRLVYQARVYVCNTDLELRLGMPATVKIDFDTPPVSHAAGSEKDCQD